MSKQEIMKMQTCVLKVNIQCHCEGCYTKIKKLLQKVEGVYNTSINPEQGKVTVTGNVDPAKLIKKLEKSGKHAELWGAPKGFNNVQNQFMNMQLHNTKGGGGGKDNKSQKGGKGGQPQQILQQMPQFKGSKDLKLPQKDQKSVKFNMEDDYIDDSDDFDDEDFDDDDFDDEDFDDDDEDDEELGHPHPHGHGHGQGKGQFGGNKMVMPNKMMPMAMMGNGMMGGPPNEGAHGGKAKKGGGEFEIPVAMKGKGGGNDGKNGKKGDGEGKNGKSKDKKEVKDKDKDKSKSKSKDAKSGVKSGIGAFLSFGRTSKNGREKDEDEFNIDKIISNNGGKGGHNNNNGHGPKKGPKNNGPHHLHNVNIKGGPGKNPAQMGGQTGGQPTQMGGMGGYPGAQGMPMNGQYQGMMGMGMGGGALPYSQLQLQLQQQQYMAMMMNQQRQNGNDMFQPMMYARPHPAVNYMPPPPMPSHPMADPYTHIFSDENAESCSIM